MTSAPPAEINSAGLTRWTGWARAVGRHDAGTPYGKFTCYVGDAKPCRHRGVAYDDTRPTPGTELYSMRRHRELSTDRREPVIGVGLIATVPAAIPINQYPH